MKHYPQVLVLEITRRCNLVCKHCMRGSAQEVDISKGIVEKVFDDIAELYTLCLSGGEPSLNVDGIRCVVNAIKSRGIKLARFEITTNGIGDMESFLGIVDELYTLCYQHDNCTLQLSIDEYHPKCSDTNLTLLMDKPYFKKYTIDSILNIGNAKKLDIHKEAYLEPVNNFEYQQQKDRLMDYALFYVTATGDVIRWCDYEYSSTEKLSLGNLKDKSFADIVEKYGTLMDMRRFA